MVSCSIMFFLFLGALGKVFQIGPYNFLKCIIQRLKCDQTGLQITGLIQIHVERYPYCTTVDYKGIKQVLKGGSWREG